MNGIFFLLAAVLLLPACCTTVGAAGVFLMRTTQEPKTRRMLCGMAAGIMLAASVWSLLLPAIQRAEEGPLPAWLPPTAGLVIGAVGLLRLEQAAGTLLTGAGAGHCGRMVLAVTLHNLPEGMVVGLAAALALSGEADAMSGALALALGIGLQNLPAGAAVSLAGIIGFVGLIVPHFVRRLTGEKLLPLLLSSALGGAAFVTLCDTAARTVFAPYELPVGILLNVIGGVFFLYLLLGRKRGRVYD